MTNDAATANGTDATPESGERDAPTAVGVKFGSARTTLVFDDGDAATTVQVPSCLVDGEDALPGDERVSDDEGAVRRSGDRAEFMLRSGVPATARDAELFERFVRELCERHDLPAESAVVYAMPTVDDRVGLANFGTAVGECGLGGTLTRGLPESLCASIPALGDGIEAVDEVFVALDLGPTNLEACAYRHGTRLLPFVSAEVSGDRVDRRIAEAVEAETEGRATIDPDTAREYKETHADFGGFEPFTDAVERGDGDGGDGVHEFTVERGVMEPLDDYLDDAVTELSDFFSRLASSHMKTYQLARARPLVVTGGMACIPGLVAELESRLAAELDRPVDVVVPDDPTTAAAAGAHRLAVRLRDRNAT
ncbi:hypothetical protein [Haloferax volcanii]|uniref:Uncharacterized protein n=3 Tax=Haloferax volcanii TaxID=2246 RepID=D4GWW7_HALVD|nr:hypothetical protein [Haloferax volcanii]ADE03057.1 uncharacterized protein HVO_1202 [Haloferax volcanii DS2]ELY28112.1 hypothetical protein C498_12733 [Haloferax volcanii DS2]MBS8117643.1 hypothetical protein [Haloferax volcanii]MBS8122655.1 hypothetical protein [Haloferax volcanii]MBS8126523.1 hypothetical protein [Haloferax volcanii]